LLPTSAEALTHNINGPALTLVAWLAAQALPQWEYQINGTTIGASLFF
jgi:hypothetical protein